MGVIAEQPAGQAEALQAKGFELMRSTKPQGLVRRLLTTWRHFLGLLAGGLTAHVRTRREEGTARGPSFFFLRMAAALTYPFVNRILRVEPFPVQLRRRLERLGPTYIKLGQILSLREDLLPKSITNELKHLLNRLPVVPLPVLVAIIEKDLKRSVDEAFLDIDPVPLGSASIGQTHRATTRDGDPVIVKVVKPGIRETPERDARLLRMLGRILQLLIPQFQPRQLVDEFCDYTLREVDLRREADNAETFSANFTDEPDVAFPAIYRDLSGRSVLTMEFFDGVSPDSPEAQQLSEEERRHLTDLGAQSIIRMLYRDGFFHADLHPGNLLILPGPRIGFIDLGMVGRLDEELRRTLLYYYFALVMGDAENSARYLAAIATPGPGANVAGFRREVTEIASRWKRASSFEEYSLGQLILDSISRGAQYRMYFPVELVLMVKALVTFEGVGHVLLPGFDVAEVSKRHIRVLFIHQFSPLRLLAESMRGAPDMVDAMAKMPLLVTDGLRVLEKVAHQPPQNPLTGLRGTLIAGSCLVAAAISMGFGVPWPVWTGLFVIAFFLALRKG
ncbi:MAG: AarF/ABC1/UbiB kinase family protein [Gemmatimonadales bacterium]|nr:MAG: AarF/ABC1/UbiB kinase family protein [Gemmatimonadales bacterium]